MTAVAAAIILTPIFSYGVQFQFYSYNLVFALSGLTLLRYLLDIESHPLAHSKLFKVLIIFAVPILFFPVIEGLHDFIEYSDREGLQTGMSHLSFSQQNWLSQYIRSEYLLLGIATMVGILLMIVKMIRSLWRQYKFESNE